MSRRSLFSTVACLLLGALAANASPDDTRILTPPDYTTFIPPIAGESYKDPVFRTRITRITDAPHTTDIANVGNLWRLLILLGETQGLAGTLHAEAIR